MPCKAHHGTFLPLYNPMAIKEKGGFRHPETAFRGKEFIRLERGGKGFPALL